jgi:CheY-like chemotaxis protein
MTIASLATAALKLSRWQVARMHSAEQPTDDFSPWEQAGFSKHANPGELVRELRCHPDTAIGQRYHSRYSDGTSRRMTGKPVSILLVDDDKVDAMIIKRSFHELRISNPVIEAHDGLEALERLRGQNGYEQVPSPCLVLLDLNMPRMGGIEFLGEVRRDPSLRRLVVFVMTTSLATEDRKRAYDQNVAGYLLKSGPGQRFAELVGMLQHFWRAIEFPD